MQPYIDYIISAEKLPFAMVALFVSVFTGFLFGPLQGRLNPGLWGVLQALFERPVAKLNRPNRAYSDLFLRGFLLTITCCCIAFLFGALSLYLSVHYPVYGLTAVLLLLPLLSGGSVWRLMLDLHKDLTGQDKVTKTVYYPLSLSTRYNLSTSDDYTITRLGIVFSTMNFTRALVGPVFWFLIGGLPMAYLTSALSFMSWRTGKGGYSRGFGVFAAKMDKVFMLIPAFITSMLFMLASFFTPTASPARAMRALFTNREEISLPYIQGGQPVAITAWALNTSLGGAYVDYEGTNIKNKWIGPKQATARLGSGYLKRALYLQLISFLLMILALGIFMQISSAGI